MSLVIEDIREVLSAGLIDPEDAVRVIDSAPIQVCTYGRSRACQTVQGEEYAGWMSSRKAPFYGLHLVLTTTTAQVTDQWLLAPAAEHDSRTGLQLLEATHDLYVIGDTAYRTPWIIARLKERQGIHLLAPPQRRKAKVDWPKVWRRQINRLRRRIESAWPVLTTVFGIEHPQARSWTGVLARITSGLLAYTLSFYASAWFERN